jgi:hypothetical protein
VGPCPAESTIGPMEKMPHRSDCQIWRRTAERPVWILLPALSGTRRLISTSRSLREWDLSSSGACGVSSPEVNLERWSTIPEVCRGGFARQARVDLVGIVKKWEGYGVYRLGEASSLYKSAMARSICDISMMRRAGQNYSVDRA